jgi:peptidylprolyl isomerase
MSMRALVRLLVVILYVCAVPAMAQDAAPLPPDPENTLYLDLTYGRVVIRMRPDLAPVHVARLKHLVRGGFYDGLAFHRVISGFMAQAGDKLEDGGSGTGRMLKAEFSKTPQLRGVVSMARASGRNSADSAWFIVLANSRDELDGKYTVWGEVTAGMDFVDMIKKGDMAQDGKVREPDLIVRMQVAADADRTQKLSAAELLKTPGDAAREFSATEFRCGALVRGGTVQAVLAQLWTHGFIAGRMKAENRVNVAGGSQAFEAALTTVCTNNPVDMVIKVAGRELVKSVKQLPAATSAMALDRYTCKDYVSARKAPDKTRVELVDLWMFAVVQGYKNIGETKVDIAFKDRAKIMTALEAVCAKNPTASFLDYATAVASKVTIK